MGASGEGRRCRQGEAVLGVGVGSPWRRKECVERMSGGKKCGKGREGRRERSRKWNGGLV